MTKNRADALLDGTAPQRVAKARAARAARKGPCEVRGCAKKVALEGACFCAPHGRAHVARGGAR